MNITVLLCTFNRCKILVNALESVASLKLPDSVDWEVLVVDNNSNDQTHAVVEDFSLRFPGRFRYLFESRPGKSYALNMGIREAKGDILAFIDDDVTVEPDWLWNLTANFAPGRCVGAGGRILPQWNCPPPRWLPLNQQRILAPLVMFDLGDETGLLKEPPFGTNMAFYKCLFQKYGDFRTDLGPRPGSEIRSEDTEFGRRLLMAGEPLRYEPSAIVHHQVTENRLRKQYFLDWWFDKARADIREFGLPPGTKFYFLGIPLFLFRRLAVWTIRWLTSIDSPRRFSYKLAVWMNAGQIRECFRMAHGAKDAASSVRG